MPDQSDLENTQALKLVALDQEGLEIISAHCQDAVLRVEDMAYVTSARRFALLINRFDWENALEEKSKGAKSKFRRRRAALRFECVNAVRRYKIDLNNKDGVKKLLVINFEEDQAPSGTINLIFSGGGEIKLEVECIESAMQDLGAVWETKSRPDHNLS